MTAQSGIGDSFGEFEAQIPVFINEAVGKKAAMTEIKEKIGADETLLRALAQATQDIEERLYHMYEEQIGPTNELFASGKLPVDEMIRRATLLVQGLRGVGSSEDEDLEDEDLEEARKEKEGLDEELEAVKKILPQLQEPGTIFGLFDRNPFRLRRIGEPAYLEIDIHDGTMRLKIPDTQSSGREPWVQAIHPAFVAVGEVDTIERYKEELPSVIETARRFSADSAIIYNIQGYPYPATVIECAQWGRVMKNGPYGQDDKDIQELIAASQEPLIAYVKQATRLLSDGSSYQHGFSVDSDVAGYLKAVTELNYMNPEIIDRVLAELVEAAAQPMNDDRYLSKRLDVIQSTIIAAQAAPKDESVYDKSLRIAQARVVAASRVHEAYQRRLADTVQ